MTDLWAPRRRAHRLARIGEVLLLLLIAVPAVQANPSGAPTWLSHTVNAALFAAALLRHKTLRWTAVLAAAAALVQIVEPATWAVMANILYAPILYSYGASRSRRWRRFGLGAAVAGSLLAAFVLAPRFPGWLEGPTHEWALRLVFILVVSAAVAVGGWAAGFMRWQNRSNVEARVEARLHEAERARLTERADQAAERERIATEMHDVVAHSWAVVAAQADGARYALKTSPEQAEKALDVIGETARTAIGDLRKILAQLRFEQPDEGTVSPEQQAATLERLRVSGLDLDFAESGERPDSPLLTLTAHRLLSEALTNALKHGDHSYPTRARLAWEEGFTLDVTNRIAGGGPGLGTRSGLVGMRERVTLTGGTFSAAAHNTTWTLHAHVPEGDS